METWFQDLGSHVEVTRVVTGIWNRLELVSNCFVSVMGCNRNPGLGVDDF